MEKKLQKIDTKINEAKAHYDNHTQKDCMFHLRVDGADEIHFFMGGNAHQLIRGLGSVLMNDVALQIIFGATYKRYLVSSGKVTAFCKDLDKMKKRNLVLSLNNKSTK